MQLSHVDSIAAEYIRDWSSTGYLIVFKSKYEKIIYWIVIDLESLYLVMTID